MIRCIIIDDEPSAVNVLCILLKKKFKNEVTVIATAANPLQGKALIEQYRPDLVFIDIEMPGMTGIDLIRSFKNPDFRFVFVTAYDAYAVEAFRVHAIDYLLKPLGAEDVINTMERIKKDISRDEQSLTMELRQFKEKQLSSNHELEPLTNREHEILNYLAKGLRYKEIADQLFISVETVRKHITNIYTKLQVQSRMEAVNKIFGERGL